MKLAVFGGTGRTGIPLIQQAIDAGNEVISLARTPSKMPIQHDRLKVVQGDVMNAADVEKVVAGADAVLVAIGHTRDTPRNMQAVAARNIVDAMKKCGVRRLVALTGAGVAAPQDKPKLFNHLIKLALMTFSPGVYRDSLDYTRIIRESGLDWVIVRVPMLNEKPHTGSYRVGWVGINTSRTISRADVADFMLKQARDNGFLHQMPMVSD
jgi:putative NADH-flavin reductase